MPRIGLTELVRLLVVAAATLDRRSGFLHLSG